jgi:FAD:protein FMN transferase
MTDTRITNSWPAWGTTVSVTTLDPAAQRSAVRLVQGCLAKAEKVAATGHRGSQVHRLMRKGGRLRHPSSLLTALVAASVEGSRYSGGLLDATVGNATWRLSHGPRPSSGISSAVATGCGGGTATSPTHPAPGYEQIRLDTQGLQVPAGLLLDVSATGKAVVATAAATYAAERLGTGVLVDLGGDVAADGPPRRAAGT